LSILAKALRGIRVLGPHRALEVVLFSLEKAWLDRHYAPPRPDWASPGIPPGRRRRVIPVDGGVVVEFESARMEALFLASDLVRVTWQPGVLPVPFAIARHSWAPPETRLDVSEAGVVVATNELRLAVDDAGALEVHGHDGYLLRTEDSPLRHGPGWATRWTMADDDRVHGLGERAAAFDLRGGSYELWNQGPGGSYTTGHDPLYLGIPVLVTMGDERSTLVFFENSHRATVDLGTRGEARFDGGALRYYLIPGPPDRALTRYTELTGRPPMPPRWALGYHQSRWGYGTAQAVREVVDGFATRDLPLAAVHLDIDVMDQYRVFTFDPHGFPDPAALVAELEQRGVKVVSIIDPGVARDPSFDVFADGRAADVFCRLPSGRLAPVVVWPGRAVLPDFTAGRARRWWASQYRRLDDLGVAGAWHDMNEPTAIALIGGSNPPLGTRHDMDGRGGDHAEAHNIYGLLMNQAGHEALAAQRPGRRPFVLSRSGWAGVQRWAWSWTGDTETSWSALRQTIPTVLGLGMSGLPYTGPDIGGYHGSPDAELYVRWFELATFLPFMRTHSSEESEPREPWVVAPDHVDHLRRLLRLRQSLLPYLETLAWEASTTGRPLVRPLWWPDDPSSALARVDDAFLLGDALLVAPVLEQGTSQRRIELPAGTWWRWHDGVAIEGGQQATVSAPLGALPPLLVRDGSALPMKTDAADAFSLHVWPPAPGATGAGALYCDDGEGYGDWSFDRFALTWDGDRLIVGRRSEGNRPRPELTIVLRGRKPEGGCVLAD
jgi:alpha-glucosidase